MKYTRHGRVYSLSNRNLTTHAYASGKHLIRHCINILEGLDRIHDFVDNQVRLPLFALAYNLVTSFAGWSYPKSYSPDR